MPKENVTITGELKDRVKNLLGGVRPTPTRMQRLMDELEQYRALHGALPQTEIVVNDNVVVDNVLVDPFSPETADFRERPGEPEDPDEDNEPTPEPPHAEIVPMPDPVKPIKPRDPLSMILDRLNGIQEQIDDLKKPRTEADSRAEAVANGRLPTRVVEAPPLGLSGRGPNAWPVGKWFTSPLGPKVPHKICACCGRGTQHHWFCAVCKSGPHHYPTNCREHSEAGRGPIFVKSWYGAGAVWGISHSCCSVSCRDNYLSMIGVIAGVNDVEGVKMPAEATAQPDNSAEPQRPARTMDSD